MTSPEALTALGAALSVEHETIYAYAVIAAHADAAADPLARSAYDAHVGSRDRLAALVRAAGATPVAADPAYAVAPVSDRASTLALAAAVEDGCAAAYEKLVVAADDAGLRASAANALVESATRAARWRLLAGSRQTMAFPGRG